MVKSFKASQNPQPFLQDLQKPDYKCTGETAPWGRGAGGRPALEKRYQKTSA